MKSDLYIYAETAFHHQGEMEYMLALIDIAAKSNIQGIKFQVLLDYDYLMSKNHPSYEALKNYTFTREEWTLVFQKAKDKNLDIILMPLDLEACEFIEECNPEYVEIHSICFYDTVLLDAIRKSMASVIIGVGGRELEEIKTVKDYFGNQLKILMTGFQSFPTDLRDVKLRRIKEYVDLFPELIIGYADHSSYENPLAVKSNEYALLYGARMFEKHITVNEGEKRVDYESAIGLNKLVEMRNTLASAYHDLRMEETGSLLEIEEPELTYRNRQKMAVASKDLPEGTILSENDILFRMTGEVDGIARLEQLTGKKLRRSLKKYDHILPNYL